MEERSVNKNGFNYPQNNAAKAILWSLYPIAASLLVTVLVAVVFVVIVICTMVTSGGLSQSMLWRMISDNYGILHVAEKALTLGAVLPIFLIHRKYLPRVEKCSARTVVLSAMFVAGAFAIIGALQSLVFELLLIRDMAWEETQEIIISMPFVFKIVSTVILAPIVEEIMFRGIIVNRLMSRFPIWIAVAVSSALFGLVHLNLYQGVFAGLGGVALALIYIKTRSLWACIFAHAANNLYATLTSYVEWSGEVMPYVANVIFGFVMLVPVFIFWRIKANKERETIDFSDGM
ncbi:MAG: CPBP family intramembrane metalloprotease [Clostridia bacterium]|nr:CPBP family intramembrane metalloprotease [Clostridia bacterium]